MSNAETADAWEHAAELEKELAQVKAELSTERECRVAAEGYIAAIPAMCTGDFSQPCALHVRAPIESLRAQLAAAVEKACKPHPKCPACHGSGTFQASDEGGMWVACDCAANIYLKLEKAERELDGVLRCEDAALKSWRATEADRDRLAGELEKVRAEARALLTAVTFKGAPEDFNGVPCYEARVPVGFVEGMRAALSQPALAQAPDAKGEVNPYDELILAVGKKTPGETRHQTALRYIREAELGGDSTSKQERR